MISTPETGVDSIAVTYALLDPVMTVVRPIAAFFTAMSTGLFVNLFTFRDDGKEQAAVPAELQPLFPNVQAESCSSSCCCNSGSNADSQVLTVWQKTKKGMAFSFGDLLSDIGPWLLFGILLSGLISVSMSPEFVSTYLGDGLLSMVVMIFVATPLYVCATASTPIAAALALKGLSPGAALVFLLAGPATNVATITVVAKLLGRKTAVIYVASIMGCSLVLGLVINQLYFFLGLDIGSWISSSTHESHGLLYTASALLLLLLIGKSWGLRLYTRLGARKNSHHGHNHRLS